MINISRDDLNNYNPISIDTKFAVVYDVDDDFVFRDNIGSYSNIETINEAYVIDNKQLKRVYKR